MDGGSRYGGEGGLGETRGGEPLAQAVADEEDFWIESKEELLIAGRSASP